MFAFLVFDCSLTDRTRNGSNHLTNALSVRSTKHNSISGEAADKLAAVIVDMPSMVDFGGVPIKSLRDNTVTDLDLSKKGLGVPEALVLCHWLSSTSSLVKLK